jgi:DNA mismatch repair protein MutL
MIKVNPYYNPFDSEKKSSEKIYTNSKSNHNSNNGIDEWQKHFEQSEPVSQHLIEKEKQELFDSTISEEISEKNMLLLKNRYIVSPVHSGIWVIDRVRATERILYETFLIHLSQHKGSSQQLLFPEQLQLNPADYSLIKELENELHTIGFDFSDLGNGTIAVNGVPSDASDIQPTVIIETLLEDFKNNSSGKSSDKYTMLASSMAKTVSRREQHILNNKEMNLLVHTLFQCEVPNFTPAGKPTLITFTLEELAKKFD